MRIRDLGYHSFVCIFRLRFKLSSEDEFALNIKAQKSKQSGTTSSCCRQESALYLECSLFGFLELPSCRRLGFLGFRSFCILALEKKKLSILQYKLFHCTVLKEKLIYINQTWNITVLLRKHLTNRRYELCFYQVLRKHKWKFGRIRNASVSTAYASSGHRCL